MRYFFIFLLSVTCAFGAEESERYVRRVQAHLLIQDSSGACKEAAEGLKQHPRDTILWEAYIRSLAKAGNEKEMMSAWEHYVAIYPKAYENRKLLEDMSWGVIEKGASSTLPIVRLMALLGAFFSQDAKGVDILYTHLSDPNASVRAISVELSGHLRDAKLGEAIMRLLREERIWKVRLEAIMAAGSMKLYQMKPDLTAIIANDKSAAEEKAAAIQSLVNLLDTADRAEVEKLSKSDRAGLRILSCQVVAHFGLTRDLDCMIGLLKDHCSEVRGSALEAIGKLDIRELSGKPVAAIVEQYLNDPDEKVAITAAWVLTKHDPEKGQKAFQQLLRKESRDTRLMAAAALAACGKYSLPLSLKAFQEHPDSFVRMNLAFALIGQRIETDAACEALYEGLTSSQERWMWKEEGFCRVLAPSDLKFADAADNHPEEVNQLVHLEVLNIIAMMKYPKAQEAIVKFLQEKTWGVSAMASSLLLTEGDDASIELVSQLLNHPSPKVRVQAALILSLWSHDEKAIGVLQEAYATADRDMKGRILEGLGRIGAQSSIPFLVDKLQDPQQSLRIIAACVLLQCLYH